MKGVLGRLARAARGAGLAAPMAWTRDALDAALLRANRPVLSATAGSRRLHGFLRHRSFLADIEGRDYEPSLKQLILDGAHGGALFVDIGAHIGFYSVLAAANGAEVVAVEPDPYNNAALRRNVAGLDVEVRSAAVSDSVGRATFHPSASTTGSSLLDRSDIPMRDPIQVETTTVDALVAGRYDRPVVVKIDVEGAEPLALAGAAETLRRAEQLLVVAEINPAALAARGYTADDVLRPLRDASLELTFVDQGGELTQEPTGNVKGNVVATRRPALA